ncbi:MAG: hypothetical protein A2Z38_04935 [Planctomycetes bacterium RBG_19FT_COMBO_48_8]|nr:MAG: hypothetical protein A2Z38_04935 [Planctomycetes bacterium RBG_19FT_COMBO_48_8]
MESVEAELQEMLEIGLYLGSGPRYLLYYYGQLAITNDAGLNRKLTVIIKQVAQAFSAGAGSRLPESEYCSRGLSF